VAYDRLADGLKLFPADPRLRQLLALSLARSGAARRANQILTDLSREGHADEETFGILARTHKDLATDAATPAERQHHLTLAFRNYWEGYLLSHGYYSGINAATMALLTGKLKEATALARDVRAICLDLRAEDSERADMYWILATLGEASLLVREWSEANDWYRQAVAIGRGRLGDLASTRRNARLIVEHLEGDVSLLESVFRIPRVVVFAGHLIDRPDRPQPRFPPALEPFVRTAIRDRLQSTDVGFAYSAAGCGADILFLEVAAERGAETHVVLPYNREQFREDSVDIVPGSDWGERYERVLAGASEIITASDQRMAGGGMSFEYGFLILDGTAGIRADELDTELMCLAVWDGKPSGGPGGTGGSVERWRAGGRLLEVIDLEDLRHRHGGQIVVRSDAPPVTVAQSLADTVKSGFDPKIVGLLFADARGFSHLTEEEVPLFVEHFLGTVADQLARCANPPVFTNTWGDGLYFVFKDVRDTGQFALDLCDAIRTTDWKSKGFSTELSLRIGLHAGPTFECLDPVTGRPNYIGAHVSHAARIEPITPPGEVYASGEFAAVARADHIRDFVCAYVGQTPLAKGYGTFPTYVVHRRREAPAGAIRV
jgi:class 3 adenylate cyclase